MTTAPKQDHVLTTCIAGADMGTPYAAEVAVMLYTEAVNSLEH